MTKMPKTVTEILDCSLRDEQAGAVKYAEAVERFNRLSENNLKTVSDYQLALDKMKECGIDDLARELMDTITRNMTSCAVLVSAYKDDSARAAKSLQECREKVAYFQKALDVLAANGIT